MASSIDRAYGIVERTSADLGEGYWFPGMPLTRGWLWAATVQGEPVVAFELAPGRVILTLTPSTIKGMRKAASGLNVVLEAAVAAEDGKVVWLTFVGPRGRMKRIFAHVGHVY